VAVLIGLALASAALLIALRVAAARPASATTAGMRVLGRLALEPRRSIYLVEVGGRCFVVGVGDGPMAMLAEVERPAEGAVVAETALAKAWRRVMGGAS
jgi:flagellar biogenesis protein FliO